MSDVITTETAANLVCLLHRSEYNLSFYSSGKSMSVRSCIGICDYVQIGYVGSHRSEEVAKAKHGICITDG